MSDIAADVLSDATNCAVVRLQSRRFPGILLQGDTVSMLEGMLGEVAQAPSLEAAKEVIQEVKALVADYLDTYERTLGAARIPLPYERNR
ncbi:DUF6959 family protein [Amycolatopsis palatopharyngis]|uniref:DUF6959 family protein n=1 Tax=Amycolatopsis palatopharyngis TaxID=187982 RepID=UPI003CCC67F6